MNEKTSASPKPATGPPLHAGRRCCGISIRSRSTALLLAYLWLLAFPVVIGAATPVIYCTDLFHPHDDPDDHFDLATLFALPELEVKAILLDQGQKQLQYPGMIPVRQMLQLRGRSVPAAIGLADKLESPDDDGRAQPAQFQAAVGLLLNTLSNSAGPVTIFATGSLRDVCASWNRAPSLFRQKVGRLYLNIGNADPGGSEYNVDLDPKAYVGMLRSGLPLYLCLCMPMARESTNAAYSTWWHFKQAEVLESAPEPLKNFFIYALQRASPGELDPLKALSSDLRPWHRLVWDMDRNMWCTAPFLHAAGRTLRKVNGSWISAPGKGDESSAPVFTFVPARIAANDDARLSFKTEADEPNANLFKVIQPAEYGAAMRDCLRELLRQ